MKKINKNNGEMILCSDHESELDDNSLLEEGGKEESFKQNLDEEFYKFGVTEDINVVITFDGTNKEEFIETDSAVGTLKSYKEKRKNTDSYMEIQFFVDIMTSIKNVSKINELQKISYNEFNYRIHFMHTDVETKISGKCVIMCHKISKIKNGKVLHKIILKQCSRQ